MLLRLARGIGLALIIFAAFIATGTLVTWLTVWDLVPTTPRQQRCATLASQHYDNPFERIAMLFGDVRVLKVTDPSNVEVEAFTIYRIPILALRGQPDARLTIICDYFSPEDFSAEVR